MLGDFLARYYNFYLVDYDVCVPKIPGGSN